MTNLIEAVRQLVEWDDEMRQHKEENKYRLTDVSLFKRMLTGLRVALSEVDAQPAGQVTRELEDFADNLLGDSVLKDVPYGTHLQQTLRSIIELSRLRDQEASISSKHVLAHEAEEEAVLTPASVAEGFQGMEEVRMHVIHQVTGAASPEFPLTEAGLEEVMMWAKEATPDSETFNEQGFLKGIVQRVETQRKQSIAEGDGGDPNCSGCGKPMSEHKPDMPDYIRRLLSQDPEKMVELQGKERKQVLEDLASALGDSPKHSEVRPEVDLTRHLKEESDLRGGPKVGVSSHNIKLPHEGGSRADSPLIGERVALVSRVVELGDRVSKLDEHLERMIKAHQDLQEQVLRFLKEGAIKPGVHSTPDARIKDIEAGLHAVSSGVDEEPDRLERGWTIASLKSQIEENTQHLTLMREHMEVEDTMVVRLVTTDQCALELKEQVEKLKGRMDTPTSDVVGLKDQMGALGRGLAEHRATVEGLKERLDGLSLRLTGHVGSQERHASGTEEADNQESLKEWVVSLSKEMATHRSSRWHHKETHSHVSDPDAP